MRTLVCILLLLSPAVGFADKTADRLRAAVTLEALLADAGLSQGLRFEKTFQFPSPAEDGQERVDVTLTHERLGTIRFLMKGPQGFWRAPAPTYRALVVFSGFGSGQDVIENFAPVPGTVLIGFDYRYSVFELVDDPARMADMIRRSPGQMAAVLSYVASLPWVKRGELATLGISMGGLFQPAALRMAKRLGTEPTHVIFAYTGAHLAPMLEQALPPGLPELLRRQLVLGVMNAITLYEPKTHLPWLRGHFLVIRATEEQVFPRESWESLEALLMAPKVVLIPGPHIGLREVAMIARTRDEIFLWWKSSVEK